MKRLLIALSMAGALCAQAALQLNVNNYTVGHQAGFGGGEFNVTLIPGTTFQTFCLETDEFIGVPAGPYNVTLNTAAVAGGVGGPSPDPISLGTAWLYSRFISGALAVDGYVYAAGAARDASGRALQEAIWWFEQENGGVNNALVAAATAALGGTVLNDANGAYGVYVMNLWHLDSTGARVLDQDMLVVPEPATIIAGALLLLPFGASALRVIRRKA